MDYILIKHISNKSNSSAVSNKGIFSCHGYSFEEFPDAFDMHPFTDRANSLGSGITFFTLWQASH